MPTGPLPTPNGKPTTPTVAPKGKKPATTPTTTKVKTTPIYVQPDFDPRLRSSLTRPFLDGAAGIRRGFLIWDDSIDPPGGTTNGYDKKDTNYPARVRFLFNPSTISTSYQIADGSAQAALNYGTTQGIDSSLLLPIQQQTSFTLMFDRTYELNGPYNFTDAIQRYGVDMDIAALRQYTGMFAGVYAGNANYIPFSASNTSTSTSGTARTDPNQINTVSGNGPLGKLSQGIMQVTIGYLYFSGPTSTAVGSDGYGITYYGYIDSWSVEYTHFTQNMIPVRAVVDISFTFLPPPAKAPAKNSAALISAQQAVDTPGAPLLLSTVIPATPPAGTVPAPGGKAGR